ncbi:MAG: hypothetical protein CL609_11595 [Anaerolineaceae bacterium]|nr:hypothetical protein [Anaerolineaceae bacterium]
MIQSSIIYSKIGLIGDVHAEDILLSSALSFLIKQSVDLIVCTGDIVNGIGNVNDCCKLLKEHQVLTVRGNHDRWYLTGQNMEIAKVTKKSELSNSSDQFIRELPEIIEFQSLSGKILLCHGIGKYDMKKINEDDYGYALESNYELQEVVHSHTYQFMINGHSHRRMIRKFNDLIVINAGTLLQAHEPTISILDINLEKIQFFDYDELSFHEKQKPVFLKTLQTTYLPLN